MTEGSKFDSLLKRKTVDTIQINLGNRCNQTCIHCHVDASPEGKKDMDSETAEKIINKILKMKLRRVEFTGGAPEMNQYLGSFVENLRDYPAEIAVRTNLTIMEEKDYEHFPEFFAKNGVELIASLPDVFRDTTDHQRGNGVFDKSIKVLKKLNDIGYGKGELKLNLVYNPDGDFLPPSQGEVENRFRSYLGKRYGIMFSNLHTIVNSPVNRFKKRLEADGVYEKYSRTLQKNHNEKNIDMVMCTSLVSVDYEGFVYDCDFNLSLGMKIKGYEDKKFWEIDFSGFTPEISSGIHCYACTVNFGSSCQGALSSSDDGNESVRDFVKDYYGNELAGTQDLKTGACCTTESLPDHIKEILLEIKDEIKSKYYGCGSPIPSELEGLKILDVGCGTGRDCYIMSRLAGEKGFVFGIDMTGNQLNVAKKYVSQQTQRFGYKNPNVKFIQDYIEDLDKHFSGESLDIVTSNCVINLLEDKQEVLNKIFRILKYGGEFYFSDVYSDRRIPEELKNDEILYGECLAGALYYKDFERIAKRAGFVDPRIISSNKIDIKEKSIKRKVGNINFFSITYRLWKLEGLEDACEDYGHIAIYRGGCAEGEFSFALDNGHVFELSRPVKICGNTEKMLSQTRFSKFFDIIGSYETHFGLFENCSGMNEEDSDNKSDNSGNCC